MEFTLRRFGTWLSQKPWRTTRRPSYGTSSELCGLVLPDDSRFSNSETGTLVTGAICIAAATAGGAALAKPAANAIAHVANTVAAVPVAETRVTAIAMLAAVTEYACMLKEEPNKPFTAIYDRARSTVPAASVLAVSEGLPEALGNIADVMSAAMVWERTHLATAIVIAITKVTNAVASASGNHRQSAARTYSIVASHVADRVGNATRQHPDLVSTKSPPAGTDRTSCEAVLQAAQLEAALYAVQGHAEQFWHVRAASALGAIAASAALSGPVNEWSSATCTCSKDSGSCEAVVRVRRMRAVLQALWSYNMRAGHHEVVDALTAVATGACVPSSPERPVVEQSMAAAAIPPIPRIPGAPSPPPSYSAQH